MNKKIIRYITFCASLLLCNFLAMSQQQIQLTQNMFNTLSYNPAYAGFRDAVNITGTFRNQWSGFKQTTIDSGTSDNENSSSNSSSNISPSLYMISADMPIKPIKGGIGINILSDKIGAFNNISLNIGYAYQKEMMNGAKMGIGLQLQMNNIVLDKNVLKPKEDGDPLLNEQQENDFLLDGNIGFFYSKPNSFFAGFSIFNLLETKGKSTMYQEQRSFNVHGGYQFRFPSYPTIKFTPSALIKTDLSTYQIDLSGIVTVKDKYWGGLNYRINDGLGLIVGLSWKDFFGSFSYDIPMSKLARGGNFGSFEVVLGYSFKFNANKGKITQKNTRYL